MTKQTSRIPTNHDLCIKCNIVPYQMISRSEKMCFSCFLKFIKFKVRRQMDNFKVNYDPNASKQHILIGLSFGKGSLVLLDMLQDLILLQKERNNGKQGFYIHALYIDDGQIPDFETKIDKLKIKYPECQFEKSINYDDLKSGEEIVINGGIFVQTNGIKQVLDQLKSRSAKQEFNSISKRRILDWYSMAKGYQTVAYGLSLTKLSELVISLTAKGRGDVVSDYINPSSERNPGIIYPIGDIMNSELEIYLKIQEIDHLVVHEIEPPATTKLQSIDELVRQYFESVETGFPAIVSTVMKTAEKIGPKNPAVQIPCKLCDNRTQSGSDDWLKNITVDCETVIPEELCYGCTVLVQNTGIGKMNLPRYNELDILKEFSLEDGSSGE